MNWYPELYLTKTAEKKKDELIRKIEEGKTPLNTYLITLAAGRANQLEIVPAWNLKFDRNRDMVTVVLGIGCSRSEAFELVRRITEQVYQETGGAELRKYFERKMSA